MVCLGATPQKKDGAWTRYETADPTLHGPWELADASFATKANGQAVGSDATPGFYPLPNPRAGEPTHVINSGGGGAFSTGHYDAAKQKLVNCSGRGFHVGGSWGAAGQSESDGSILHIGWSSAGGGRTEPGINMMSLVTVLSYDRASEQLVTNPAGWYSKMRTATLIDRAALAFGGAGASNASSVYTPKLPAGANGAASDVTLRLELPQDASVPVAFEVRVLSAGSTSGNATSIMINVSGSGAPGTGARAGRAEQPAGVRKALLSVTSFGHRSDAAAESARRGAQPSPHLDARGGWGGGGGGAAFDVLPGESTVDLRILTDRSIVEAFAMGGRANALTHAYPAEGNTGFHFLNWGAAPVALHNLTISAMGCGWA